MFPDITKESSGACPEKDSGTSNNNSYSPQYSLPGIGSHFQIKSSLKKGHKSEDVLF